MSDIQEDLRQLFRWNKALNLMPPFSADGQARPMAVSRFFGPIYVTNPGDNPDLYPEGIPNSVINTDNYVLPNYPSVYPALAGEWGHFVCSRITFNSYVSITYKPWVGAPANLATVDLAAGALFAPTSQNGGAINLNNWSDAAQDNTVTRPHLCAELDLYNNTEGYSLTQGRAGMEMFVGGFAGETHFPTPAVWRRGTEIEPRLYVTDFRLGDFFMQEDIEDYIDNVQAVAWVNVTFIGHTEK